MFSLSLSLCRDFSLGARKSKGGTEAQGKKKGCKNGEKQWSFLCGLSPELSSAILSLSMSLSVTGGKRDSCLKLIFWGGLITHNADASWDFQELIYPCLERILYWSHSQFHPSIHRRRHHHGQDQPPLWSASRPSPHWIFFFLFFFSSTFQFAVSSLCLSTFPVCVRSSHHEVVGSFKFPFGNLSPFLLSFFPSSPIYLRFFLDDLWFDVHQSTSICINSLC